MKSEMVVFSSAIFCYGFLSSIAADYHHKGCYTYQPSLETIGTGRNKDPLLTPKRCLTECSKEHIPYFYLKSGNICACVKTIDDLVKYGESKECTTSCSGNNQQKCGGEIAIDIYKVSLCTHLKNPEYGFVNQSMDTAWFGCESGYHLKGPKVVNCNKTVYEWDITVPPECTEGRESCGIPGWFSGLLILFVLLTLLFFGSTLFFRSKLESIKRSATALPGKIEGNNRGTSVAYSLPVLQPREYAQPNEPRNVDCKNS